MPWLIQHKCNVGQSDLSEYAVVKGRRNDQDLTRVVCQNPACGEEFYILGHELFSEAVPDHSGLPPGFLIARTPKA